MKFFGMIQSNISYCVFSADIFYVYRHFIYDSKRDFHIDLPRKKKHFYKKEISIEYRMFGSMYIVYDGYSWSLLCNHTQSQIIFRRLSLDFQNQLFNFYYMQATQQSGNTNFDNNTIDASLLCLTMERMARARCVLLIYTRSGNKQMSIQHKINFSL